MPTPSVPPSPDHRSYGFQDLVRHRVHDVLLVATPYESFILAEDGQPHAQLLREFLALEIRHIPRFQHVTTGAAALRIVAQKPEPSLIIASMHVADMDAATLAQKLQAAGHDVPVVLLAYDAQALAAFERQHDTRAIDRAFLWQGDARIFLAIVKLLEDRLNTRHDVGEAGVQAVLVVEDNVRYYSSFLPVIYAEVIEQARQLAPEGLNLAHKLLRVQARPKILLCSTFEEALTSFRDYQENILGVISDVEFPKGGETCPDAGVQLARIVRTLQPDVPIVLHSRAHQHRAAAEAIGAWFLRKGSPSLLQELRGFMNEYFSFGDFRFRMPDGRVVARAADLRSLEEELVRVPAESLLYHAERNHFSKWLKARTEFALAQRLRPRKLADYASLEELRAGLIREIQDYRDERARQTIADFQAESFDSGVPFARLGGGSLGGKARGLAFMNQLIAEAGLRSRWPGVRIAVPRALVLGTDVFDEFLRRNSLRNLVLHGRDEEEIRRRVAQAPFPANFRRDLEAFLEVVREPLAVRSSSLLEDSQYQPFAGIYETVMLANDDAEPRARLDALVAAIKSVWLSTFGARSRAWLDTIGYRLEEEKMAVVLQELVGARHGQRFYPDFAGVARSRNDYAIAPALPEDGVAALALGFGATVVEGESCLRFTPRYPRHVLPFSAVGDALRNSQRQFWALELGAATGEVDSSGLRAFGLDAAEADGTLAALGSTWSADNDAVFDGVGRPGVRLVSFAGILKHDLFPLAEILDKLVRIGREGIGAPVEIEFAVNLSVPPGAPAEFGFLQLRPLARSGELADLPLDEAPAERRLCRSGAVLGHGRVEGLLDLVVVDRQRFERLRSQDVAALVARFNSTLLAENRPYLLVGVGRWGSRDPFLGIPVGWEQIAGARVIVEAGFRDFRVSPSQGSHFFQNLAATGVGYFTINPELGDGELDWDWLTSLPAVEEELSVRRIRLERPLTVLMNGRRGQGVILKPEPGGTPPKV